MIRSEGLSWLGGRGKWGKVLRCSEVGRWEEGSFGDCVVSGGELDVVIMNGLEGKRVMDEEVGSIGKEEVGMFEGWRGGEDVIG